MKDLISEPTELLEFELDVVAGGNPFENSVSFSAIGSSVTVAVASAFANAPSTAIALAVDQSVHISGS
jgi:hypothetical protein